MEWLQLSKQVAEILRPLPHGSLQHRQIRKNGNGAQ
jgi:hypothetical protein